MSSLSLHQISKVFTHKGQKVHALREVDLAVEDGELMAVVGPSGCGKTTLLRVIAGLEKPDAGKIHFDGQPIDGLAPRDRDVAMVFQNHALYPTMTVYKNIAFPLKMRRMAKVDIDRRVRAAADMLGLADLLERKPHELSGGEQQRVALGRAIVRQPRVFLFDEPLSNLDPGLRVRMRAEIKALHRQLGTTMVYVTHDQEEAMTLGDRVCVLQSGQVQQVAPPLEAYKAPTNRFVAEFLGHPAMNFLRVEVIGKNGSLRLPATGQQITLPPPCNFAAENNSTILLGIRPHHLFLARDEKAVPAGCEPLADGRVEWIENLGDSRIVHVEIPGQERLKVKVGDLDAIRMGDPVRIFFDPKKAMLFRENDRGNRIA